MSTGWNLPEQRAVAPHIINLLGNEYWLEPREDANDGVTDYKPTGK